MVLKESYVQEVAVTSQKLACLRSALGAVLLPNKLAVGHGLRFWKEKDQVHLTESVGVGRVVKVSRNLYPDSIS